jgi:uncharacterized membrane protein YcaP (DUF421 family)
MFFDDWNGLLRTLVVGILAYVAIVLLLRVTGKRTLSKMNAFDLIVTVALGSTLATVLLSESVALAEGILGFCVLVFLQFGVAWVSARSQSFRDIIKAEPTLLLHKGVAPEEVMAAVRSSGYASLGQVEAVVLETDGSFSIVGPSSDGSTSALANVSTPSGAVPFSSQG